MDIRLLETSRDIDVTEPCMAEMKPERLIISDPIVGAAKLWGPKLKAAIRICDEKCILNRSVLVLVGEDSCDVEGDMQKYG
jgi:hypothetical protein